MGKGNFTEDFRLGLRPLMLDLLTRLSIESRHAAIQT